MTGTLSSELAISLQLESLFATERAHIAAQKQGVATLKAGRPAFIAANTLDACRDYDAKIAALDLEIEHAEAKLKQAEAEKRAGLEAGDAAERLRLFSIQRIVQLLWVAKFNVEYEAACHKIVALIEAGQALGHLAHKANDENRPEGLGEIPTYLGNLAHLRQKLQLPHRDGGLIWKNGRLKMPLADGYDPASDIVADVVKQAADLLKTISPDDLPNLGIPLVPVTPAASEAIWAEDAGADGNAADVAAKPGLGRRLLNSLQRSTAATAA